MVTQKQRLHELIEELTEAQVMQVFQLVQLLRNTVIEAEPPAIIAPPADWAGFAQFDPMVVPGPPASEFLVADRR